MRYLYGHLGLRLTNVEQSYTTVNGINMGFTYGQGQTSSLGVGQSMDNPSGSFSGDGTVGVSTTRTQGFSTYTTKAYNHWQTYFLVDEIQYRCPVHHLYYLIPYKWGGGDAVYHPSGAPGAPYCVHEMRGGNWHENQSRSTTFGVGWSVFGFNGSAQTWYSGSADIFFVWNVFGHICGVYDVPGGSPGILVAT